MDSVVVLHPIVDESERGGGIGDRTDPVVIALEGLHCKRRSENPSLKRPGRPVAGAKIRQQMAFVVKRQGLGDEGRGAVRKGEALLAGLLRCGHCGRRLLVSYNGTKGDIGRYHCDATRSNPEAAPCISFGSLRVDQAVGAEIVRLLQPLGVEAAHGRRAPSWRETAPDRTGARTGAIRGGQGAPAI
jgi:hypothetical protein